LTISIWKKLNFYILLDSSSCQNLCRAIDFLPKVSSNCVSSNHNSSSSPPLMEPTRHHVLQDYFLTFLLSSNKIFFQKDKKNFQTVLSSKSKDFPLKRIFRPWDRKDFMERIQSQCPMQSLTNIKFLFFSENWKQNKDQN
jgi:hypothetical protein